MGLREISQEWTTTKIWRKGDYICYKRNHFTPQGKERIDALMQGIAIESIDRFLGQFGGTLEISAQCHRLEAEPVQNVVNDYFKMIARLQSSAPYSLFSQAWQDFTNTTYASQVYISWKS